MLICEPIKMIKIHCYARVWLGYFNYVVSVSVGFLKGIPGEKIVITLLKH